MVGRRFFSVWMGLAIVAGGLPATARAQMCSVSPGIASPVESEQDASTLPYVGCNGRVGFRTSELSQNDTDLNLDGDTDDLDFQVLDLGSATVTDVEIDGSGPLACGGDFFAFGVSEANEGGPSLNGDVDKSDYVLHVYDAGSATIDNVGIAVSKIAASASLIAFTVRESDEGADLNGDLDLADEVLHVYDPLTTITTNVGVSTTGEMKVVGDVVAFLTDESNQAGVDLNGDFDAGDTVLQVYDAGLGVVTNTMQQSESGILFDGNVVVFRTKERQQGVGSLNGDSDQRDTVPQVYCVTAGPCAVAGVTQTVARATLSAIAQSGDYVAFVSRERDQDLDMNADTDLRDDVLNVYRISTNTITSTNLASTLQTPAMSGSYVGFAVPERRQAKTDLNGDGDVSDAVYHAYNAASNSAVNTMRGAAPNEKRRKAAGDYFAFVSSERSNDKTDETGDDDARDLVVDVWQLSTAGPVQCAEVAIDSTTSLEVADDLVVFRASERDSGDDLDGNGLTNDKLVTVFDAAGGSADVLDIEALHLGNQQDFIIENGYVVYRVREATALVDLNNDGDIEDNVLMQYP